MKAWIETVLRELDREYQQAEENLRTAHQQHFIAEASYKAAQSLRNELYELVRGMREFAQNQPEGGAL